MRPTLLKLQSFISLIQGTLRGNSQTKDYTEGRGPIYNNWGKTSENYLKGGRGGPTICVYGGEGGGPTVYAKCLAKQTQPITFV